MRDPERIHTVLQKLEEVWNQCPDLRLGQLLFALSRTGNDAEVFNMEEEEWLARMEQFLETGSFISQEREILMPGDSFSEMLEKLKKNHKRCQNDE